MIAEIGEVLLFTAENVGKLPFPFDARPIEELELVQVQVVPEILLLKVVTGTEAPLHIAKSVGNITTGLGLTVIVKVTGGPVQLFRVGITVIVAVIGALVLLTAVNEGILFIPDETRPMAIFELVQVYSAPAGVLKKTPSGIEAPAQKVKLGGTVTIGSGETATSKTVAEPTHAPLVAVTAQLPALEGVTFGIVTEEPVAEN